MRRIGAIFKPPENVNGGNAKPENVEQKPRKPKAGKGGKQCTPITSTTETSTGEN